MPTVLSPAPPTELVGQIFGVQAALLIGVAGMFCAGAWVFRSPVREIGEMPSEPDHSLSAG